VVCCRKSDDLDKWSGSARQPESAGGYPALAEAVQERYEFSPDVMRQDSCCRVNPPFDEGYLEVA
jgi:hypothetical protein